MRQLLIGIVVGATVIAGILLWKQPAYDYFRREYPMLLWTGLIALLATFLGVTLAFKLETKRQAQIELEASLYRKVIR